MANKKQEPKKVQEEKTTEQKVAAPIVKKQEPKKPEWEIKDRTYYLTGSKTPLTFTIPSKHTRKHALLYFDPKTNIQKEIRYATNHNSPFKNEQQGEATLGHITI